MQNDQASSRQTVLGVILKVLGVSIALVVSALAVVALLAKGWVGVFGGAVLACVLVILLEERHRYKRLWIDTMNTFSRTMNELSAKMKAAYFELFQEYQKRRAADPSYLRTKLAETAQHAANTLSFALTLSARTETSVTIEYLVDAATENMRSLDTHAPADEQDTLSLVPLCCSIGGKVAKTDSTATVLNAHTLYAVALPDVAQQGFFCSSDLAQTMHKYCKGTRNEFQHPLGTDKWLRSEKGAIIVPIECQRARLVDGKDEAYTDLVGLIKVGVNATGAFAEEKRGPYVSYTRAVADAMYKFFERVRYYLSTSGDEQTRLKA